MLLKKGLLILLSVLLILNTYATLADCENDLSGINTTHVYRGYLKQSIFLFLANPGSGSLYLNFTELNASIKFFFDKTDVNASVLCDPAETNSSDYDGVNMSMVAQKMMLTSQRNVVPRCSEGTLYGECSDRQPGYFCYSGRLVPMCTGPDRIVGTDDDCGCPAGKTMCYDNISVCDPECFTSDMCPTAGTIYTCKGNLLRQLNGTYDCNKNYECVAKGTLMDTIDCSNYSEYCEDGYDHCVECTADEHCTGHYQEVFSCSSPENITDYYYDGRCSFNSCIPDFAKPHTELYKTCSSPGEICSDGCSHCYDTTVPRHIFYLNKMDKRNYNVVVYVSNHYDIDDSPAFGLYSFTNLTIFEYLDGVLVNNQTFICTPSSCGSIFTPLTWSRHHTSSTEFGNYTYTATLYNASGKSWHLPDFYYGGTTQRPLEGTCDGNITTNVD